MQSSQPPRLRIAWLLSAPIVGSGGYANIFRIINLLATFGHENVIFMNPDLYPTDSVDRPERYIQRFFGVVHAKIYFWPERISGYDVVLATQWGTTRGFERCDPAIRRAYFVQDFEPFFYAMGDDWLRAEATYKQGWPCITLGHWLAKHLHEQYQATTYPFDFAVEHERYYPRPELASKKPRVIFYARPSTPRRCFDLGIKALALVKEQRPDVEIVLFGDKGLKHYWTPFEFTDKGILTPDELAELYASATAGLVISSTNPSLMPPEMMATGCPVIDLDLAPNHFLVDHGKTGLLAPAEPAAVAKALLQVLNDQALRQRLINAALAHAKTLSWERSARDVEQALGQIVGSAVQSLATPQTMPDSEHPFGDGVTPALSASFQVGQRFVAQHDGLCRWEIPLAHAPQQPIRLQLYDALLNPDQVMVDTKQAQYSDGWLSFEFAPLPASRNQALHAVLSCDQAPGLRFDFQTIPGGSLSYNGMPQVGRLCYRSAYAVAYEDQRDPEPQPEAAYLAAQQALMQAEYLQLSAFAERLHAAYVPKKSFPERATKAVKLLRSGNVLGLARESTRYLHWLYDRAKARWHNRD